MIELEIAQHTEILLKELYHIDVKVDENMIQKTKKEFEGNFTIVLFPYIKLVGKPLPVFAEELGQALVKSLSFIESYNCIKGFLNLSVKAEFWIHFLKEHLSDTAYGYQSHQDHDITLIEFSSPNTNKPLHLGHIRNNLLGSSVSKILTASGKKVVKVNLVNDRGIHICKSMLAWQKFGNGETPESSHLKGDHLVGKYYVEFDKHYKAEIESLVQQGLSKEEAEQQAPLIKEAQNMLKKWENNDPEIVALWKTMNEWVYAGFDETYQRLGIQFDKIYYESQTYLLGKKLVDEGLKNQTLYQKEDGSVWADLTAYGLDQKLLLRSNGTSVYMTQDLGTAELRYQEFKPNQMIYVVGNEQNYHFDVLKLILEKKLNRSYGADIFHLSYGMVELPFGKMKSREGTVVDADDLMDAMISEAQANTEALGKAEFSEQEKKFLNTMIGLGALKYFILKVDPKKNMLFNPEESIDFNGNTGPFIQYTHARIKSLLRKANEEKTDYRETDCSSNQLLNIEENLIHLIYEFPQTILTAADMLSPATIVNYTFELAKTFNQFYQDTPIFKEDDILKRHFRLQLSSMTAQVIKNAMSLLGIDVPERM